MTTIESDRRAMTLILNADPLAPSIHLYLHPHILPVALEFKLNWPTLVFEVLDQIARLPPPSTSLACTNRVLYHSLRSSGKLLSQSVPKEHRQTLERIF